MSAEIAGPGRRANGLANESDLQHLRGGDHHRNVKAAAGEKRAE